MNGSYHGGARQEPHRISVYILGPNRLLREALQYMLKSRAEMEVAGSSEAAQASLQDLATLRPDVLLINGSTAEFDWARVVPEARQAAPGTRVVLFGMKDDTETFLRSIRAGVAGYVLGEASASDLVKAVRCAAIGEAVCPPRLCLALFKYVSRQASIPNPTLRARHGLTRREQQLLPLISQGMTNKEIAAQLVVSEQTIKNHVSRILRKMGTHNRLSAAQAAYVSGWGP